MAVVTWITSGIADIMPDTNKNIIPNSSGACGTAASPWNAGHLNALTVNNAQGNNDSRIASQNIANLFLIDADMDKVLISGPTVHTAQARFSVRQADTTNNLPVVEWVQDDEDASFMVFRGAVAADFSKNTSTETGNNAVVGPKSPTGGAGTRGWAFTGMVKCQVYGLDGGWMAIYQPVTL